MCDHRFLDNPNGLVCTRDHDDDRGHVYAASAGPDLDTKRHATGDDQ